MANNVSNKFPNAKNVIYDSINDTSTGKKRAGINIFKIIFFYYYLI